MDSIIKDMPHSGFIEREKGFARMGTLFAKADAYDPIKNDPEMIDFQVDIFH